VEKREFLVLNLIAEEQERKALREARKSTGLLGVAWP
jgi:hypothetical protein